ncbi:MULTISPECIES: glycoside hydrolase family 20 protein [unclassified Streptomyces]|uniref:beta-N-acetylhexosaminidase n=1 Tax=unclassified Streptomyces TaxID=2593676 RepID=UPI0036602150
MWISRGTQVVGTVVAVAATFTVVGCGSGGARAGSPDDVRSASAASASASSAAARSSTLSSAASPSPTYALSVAPRSIPSVRTHEAARGPGWRPGAKSGVVIATGSEGLADEGKLLSQELKIAYRGTAKARAGDVELALASGGGAAESYTLSVRSGRVRITGPDQAGVFYGTRTLKQSVRADGAMPEGVVRDRPGRPQRGLNLDIARKYYTPGWIEDRLREMADLKLNQLGLHFSDDQGFRIESTSHPEIVSKQHLSKAEVRHILALAKRLHINVVPEIDNPGHLGAVLQVYPALQLRNVNGTPTRGAIDISQAASARLLDDLLREFAGLFPGPYWHLGADEYQALVVADPQASFPKLAQLAVKKYGSGGTVQDLTTGWTNDRAAVMRPFKRQLRVWNDGIFRGGSVQADKSLQVAYWTGKEIGARPPEEYLSAGRTMVNYNDEYLYYVLGQPNDFRYPTGQRIYEQWTPLVLRGTNAVPARYSKQILGGVFAVWGDFPNAQTQDQVANGIRLPLAAVSQKLWDPGKPPLSWSGFTALAAKVDGNG